MASTYRGKYPSRIRSIGGLAGQPGVVLVETNDGREYVIRAAEVRRLGINEADIKCGSDVGALPVEPFDRRKARAFLAFARLATTTAGGPVRESAFAVFVRPESTLPTLPRFREYLRAFIARTAPKGCGLDLRDRERAFLLDLESAFDAAGADEWALLCRRALRTSTASFAKLREAFDAIRAERQASYRMFGGMGLAALDAFELARGDAARARRAVTGEHLGHGDVIRSRRKDGSRVTFVIAHVPDSNMGAPWEEHDGHGIIREVSRREDKRPGERLFGSDERHARLYAYDIALTTLRARLDGWNTGAEYRAALAEKLGREPTARQIAAHAVEADFERMRAWTRDGWEWIGVCLAEMPKGGTMANGFAQSAYGIACRVSEGFGDYNVRASLWGIESDSGADYLDEVARDLLWDAR